MTGYRAFSFRFVKTFPVLSKGFEIETEMSIHAIDKNMSTENVIINYRDRPEGSESKLNTYKDGFKVIMMIFALIRDERPLLFFSAISLILLIIAGIYFFPILFSFFSSGEVLKIPTLIVISTVVIVAVIIFFTGVVLHVLKRQHADELEHHLLLLNEINNKKEE